LSSSVLGDLLRANHFSATFRREAQGIRHHAFPA
jgi:hypothetical protein